MSTRDKNLEAARAEDARGTHEWHTPDGPSGPGRRIMSALDLDALRCEVEALQAERDTARVDAGRLRESLRLLTRERDALIQRVREAEARTRWNFDMAAAPMDETPVMLWFARPTDAGGIGYYADGCWRDRSGTRYIGAPVAWMPLPDAPESEAP